jgi:hypothetical protein
LLKIQSEKFGFSMSGTLSAGRNVSVASIAIAIFAAPRRVIAIAFIWRTACLVLQMRPFDGLRTMSLPVGAVFFK